MRSKRFKGWAPLEEAFGAEVENLDYGLQDLLWKHAGASDETGKMLASLIEASRRYVDELNKIRKYKCPLSMSILLGSLMEGIFYYVFLERQKIAEDTASWKRWQKNGNPTAGIPLACLIGVMEDMKLLRTEGINKALLGLYEKWKNWEPGHFTADSRDAKVHGKRLHRLRDWRNAVHPRKLIDDGKTEVDPEEFIDVMFNGLALLLLLETIIGINTKHPIAKNVAE